MLSRSRHCLVALMVAGILLPATAQAQYFAKINEIRVDEGGNPTLYATVLDRYGQPPSLSALETVQINFGEANAFRRDDMELVAFKDSDEATDYVVILPAYEGFGINNAVVTAEGASAFQASYVGENDTVMYFVYGDGVIPFEGDPVELGPTFREPDGVARVARPYMLSALEEAVRYYDDLPPGRRRVIILVGTGMDVRLTDATNVEVVEGATGADWDQAQREVLREHTAILRRYIEALENVRARVYAIGYNDSRPDYLQVLDALSRKTGGTYRRVTNIGDLSATGGGSGVFGLVGDELAAELVMKPDFNVESAREYEIWASFRFPDPITQQVLDEIRTPVFYLTVQASERRLNVIPYLIAVGVILVVVFLLVLVFLALRKRLASQTADIKERKKLEEQAAQGRGFCPTCYRRMEPAWDHCLFCASGMAPLEEKPPELVQAEEAQQKLNEADQVDEAQVAAAAAGAGSLAAVAFYAQKAGKNTCKTCGRVVDPSWPECMFCKAGMAPLPEMAQAAPEPAGQIAAPVAGGGLAPMAAQPPAGGGGGAQPPTGGGGAAKTVAISPGTGQCPQCGRPTPPEWQECLYCKAGV